MARYNNLEDNVDILHAIDEIDRSIDKMNRKAGEELFGKGESEEVLLYHDMMKAFNNLVNIVEMQNEKINKLARKVRFDDFYKDEDE